MAKGLKVCLMARKIGVSKIGVRAQFGVMPLTQTSNFSPNWDPTPNLLPTAVAAKSPKVVRFHWPQSHKTLGEQIFI